MDRLISDFLIVVCSGLILIVFIGIVEAIKQCLKPEVKQYLSEHKGLLSFLIPTIFILIGIILSMLGL